ncbi:MULTISPECIES: hypothetical protein [unclassified Campylobacter]|uniref:hypothetical protein n=1 Tax=unclassified Campylobacter TaxID=2593542 RepID=UPI001237BEB4|nr:MULTISPECIES: hypothetical protein [unclassified Campylobacter]KAA6225909.1 hypothetical protein FMM55_05650 [Campylobacter sp. LR196d]KAA6226990.1 hypothetical protein FMM54_03240 [Campylobacter sp. LR185c]KAA6228864.1 hypothetical protein FMM57_02120 [Campylobacter sp. LR286c]KAA6230027.1 hypothetical protein FMM56_07065 [Campylobacter sp. LR264d]KAA6233439.1 hypothetical protein FMM58_02220 [Campylobacter sp. LR291e]
MNTINSTNSTTSLYAQSTNIEKKEILALKNETSEVTSMSQGSVYGVKVVFEDSSSGALVSLNLSDENYASLQKNFGSYTNYVVRDDKSVRLNGDAENFVSSWFSVAVSNLDNETINNALRVKDTKSIGLEALNKGSNSIDMDSDLEQRLNFLVANDSDADGVISNETQSTQSAEATKSAATSALFSNLMSYTGSSGNSESSEEEDLVEKARQQGLDSLTATEKSELKSQNPSEYARLEELANLSQNLNQDLQINIENQSLVILDKFV